MMGVHISVRCPSLEPRQSSYIVVLKFLPSSASLGDITQEFQGLFPVRDFRVSLDHSYQTPPVSSDERELGQRVRQLPVPGQIAEKYVRTLEGKTFVQRDGTFRGCTSDYTDLLQHIDGIAPACLQTVSDPVQSRPVVPDSGIQDGIPLPEVYLHGVFHFLGAACIAYRQYRHENQQYMFY